MPKVEINETGTPIKIPAKTAPQGTIGRIKYGSATVVVIRTYDGMVALQGSPSGFGANWDEAALRYYEIEPLPTGTTITITV